MNPRLLLITLVLPIFTQAQDSLPWLAKIDPDNISDTVSGIQCKADVIVSDGLTYSVNTLFIDKQRAIFKRIYADRTVVQGLEGKYVWSYDGNAETEQPNLIGDIILGHQFHSQILFFDKLHSNSVIEENANFNGKPCQALVSEEESSVYKLYYIPNGLPLGMTTTTSDMHITFVYNDWAVIDGVNLPLTISINDEDRDFNYTFSNVLFNSGSLNDFRAPFEHLTEEQKLLRLHREIMDGHYFENMEVSNSHVADSIVIVSEGAVYEISGIQSNESMNQRMKERNHTRYDDLIRPIVKISDDGTLGWVVVQVRAEGVRYNEKGDVSGPLEFVSAWIELYEKINGEWKMVGNVSNLQPGRK